MELKVKHIKNIETIHWGYINIYDCWEENFIKVITGIYQTIDLFKIEYEKINEAFYLNYTELKNPYRKSTYFWENVRYIKGKFKYDKDFVVCRKEKLINNNNIYILSGIEADKQG